MLREQIPVLSEDRNLFNNLERGLKKSHKKELPMAAKTELFCIVQCCGIVRVLLEYVYVYLHSREVVCTGTGKIN